MAPCDFECNSPSPARKQPVFLLARYGMCVLRKVFIKNHSEEELAKIMKDANNDLAMAIKEVRVDAGIAVAVDAGIAASAGVGAAFHSAVDAAIAVGVDVADFGCLCC